MSKYTKIYLGGAALYVAGATLSYFLASTPACCADDKNPTFHQQKEKVKMTDYGHIDGKTLKNLIESKTPMVLLDARTQKWDDGRRIPGGKSLPADSDPALFTETAPNKDALVVIYCGGVQCPAGKALAEKMLSEGYTHVLEYAGGIKEWADVMHYPIERN